MLIGISLPTNAPLGRAAPQQPLDEVERAAWCGRVASDIVRSRTLRHRLLAGIRMAEPTWDILLDLYLSKLKGVRVSICDVAFISGVSRSTGARVVGNLIASGALESVPDVQDGRRTWISLSAQMQAVLDVYFLQISGIVDLAIDISTHSTSLSSHNENNSHAALLTG